jgi:phosphoglycerate dehydrogenase-like enzyme
MIGTFNSVEYLPMPIRSKAIKVLTPQKVVSRIGQTRDPGRSVDLDIEVIVADGTSDLPRLMSGVDVFVGHEFNQEMACNADTLKLIQVIGAGYERVDLSSVPKGVAVCNNFEHENAVAEWVLMAMIALDRQVLRADRTLRAGSWEMSGRHGMKHPGLQDRTVGVIGLGRVGQRVIALAKAFHMRTVAVTRTPLATEAGIRGSIDVELTMEEIDKLFEQSDFVVPCVPLNDKTRNFINSRVLDLMKPTSHLINIARGEIVEEEALYRALAERRIAGAALDVWWNEPMTPESSPAPSQLPYHELDNVLMSPHASAVTLSMIDARIQFLVAQMGRLAHGEPLQNVVHVG